MTDAVAKPSEDYNDMYPLWSVTATLRGGTPAMRQAAKAYLPQDEDESAKAYENRLKRSVLTNIYTRTADKLAGKPLKKPITIDEDVPTEIRSFTDDVDMLGTRLDVFANELLSAAIDDGLTHILVDFSHTKGTGVDGEVPLPSGGAALSKRQLQEMGARPWARHVRAADLIGWKYDFVQGKKTLTQIRIFEVAKIDIDEFTQETRQRIRVYERDRWRLYEEQETENTGTAQNKKQWILIEEGPNTLGRIPLVTFYTNQTGFMKAKPWLMDIAYLNIAHWQSDSDQRNLLHVARVPILFATGFGDDETQWSITIGANSFSKGPKGAELKWVEHTGKGIEAGRNDLKDLEERMQLLGLEMLVKRPSGNTTATARTLDQAEADSALGMVSQSLENAIEEVLDLFAQWLQLGEDKAGGSVTVFKDFGIEFSDAKDIELLFKMKASGELSRLTFLREIKRRGLLADDFNPQTEIDLLDIEGPGSASIEDPADPLAPPTPEHPGRNKVGDVTSLVEGHRHVLEDNGQTSTEIDQDGTRHAHEWDEFAIRTSVEDGHSHVLLSRTAEAKSPPPPINPNPGGVPSDQNQPSPQEQPNGQPASKPT